MERKGEEEKQWNLAMKNALMNRVKFPKRSKHYSNIE